MRRVFLALLVLFALSLTGCSYGTEFVVVNDSASPVEVSYKLRGMPPSNPFFMTDYPVKLETSHLRDSKRQWQVLFTDQYRLDYGSRTVTVGLKPGEALRVAIIVDYGTRDEALETKNFPIEEITVTGDRGEIKLAGAQAHKSFSEVSDTLRTLTYK